QRLIANYEAKTRSLGRIPVKINDRKLRFFATNQNASWAIYNRNGERLITIAKDMLRSPRPGYGTYVVAHELAHHYANFKHKVNGHGEMFMYWLKQLCPPELVHYELEYKPKFARAAGIRKPEQKVA